MGNLKIGTRLGLGFGLFIFMMAAMAALGIWSAFESQQSNALMITRQNTNDVTLRWVRQVEANANQALAAANLTDPAVLPIFQSRMKKSFELAKEYRDQVGSLLVFAEGKALFEQALEAQRKYIGPRDQAFERLNKGERAETRTFFAEELPELANQYFAAIDKLSHYLTNAVQIQAQRAEEQNRLAIIMFSAVALLGLIAGLLLAWLVTRSIVRPLGQALLLAREVANRNLAHDIAVTGKDEISDLMRELGAMTTSLRSTVSDVREGADAIATAAGQISSGNIDLSSRTEQQSSSLAETAATMEEMTATVRQNADNAQQANLLAESAAKTATDGGKIMTELVATMGEINTKSQQVSDIIGVIDSIAFQTNILALNAAVEAARAGEQGRGFAVVASEVRALAQRSATAAREIKVLIDTSVVSTTKGNEQAGRAGETMQEIVTGINRVTDIMGEISAASNEQTTGIEEINIAVTQMDDVTRQNASLVDESTSAAASLEEQADTLARLVATFKLDNQHGDSQQITAYARHAGNSPHAAKRLVSSAPQRLGRAEPSRPESRKDAKLALARPAPATASSNEWAEF
ncbi:MCP four helix bundle domain-containing protein [Alcaligenaceae bacterium CGII-47]|nr:MCP four helix bundle domain-containing protein [Alcaligenaceae bacterium CGII-47]